MGCRGSLQVTPSDHATVLAHQSLDAPDPAARGPWEVATLYYGSGEDKNRPEYRDSVSIVTESVDGSKLVSLGGSARERNEYWGFTPEEMPINGRVWYPDAGSGDGPFPLVLVVHGNHDMRDFSDPGYDYLGELLASRGFILASVDMNFINGGIRGENDGRGWLLLEHLAAWKRFAETEGGPFEGMVDMGSIALIGHSRGGEAVALAAAFNQLERYPDDASLAFDYGFPIHAVVAIAPVDGQYLPTGRKAPVEDVSYLVFHGSHDGDVTSFHGLRQYDRILFSDEESDAFQTSIADEDANGDVVDPQPGPAGEVGPFKAAVYMYRANHGQWNTVWGAHDNGPRSGRILDLRYLVEPEAQRRMAEVYVTAFLESRLRGDHRWLPLFRDHRVAGEWLPETMYITRFHDASFRPIADFEEDIDVTTGSRPGIRIEGDSLATWREDMLQLRSSNRSSTSASQENQGVWLAWNNRIAGADTTRHGPPATYSILLPEGFAAARGIDGEASLHLLVAPTERRPGPRRDPAPDSAEGATEAGRERDDRGGAEEEEDPPVDLSIEVEDAAGVTARVPLSRYGPIRRPLEIHISRRPDQERERFATLWELVQQSYSIPMADFVEAVPSLEPGRLRAVRLVFDRVHAGEVVVDDVGFSRMHRAFWSARIPPS